MKARKRLVKINRQINELEHYGRKFRGRKRYKGLRGGVVKTKETTIYRRIKRLKKERSQLIDKLVHMNELQNKYDELDKSLNAKYNHLDDLLEERRGRKESGDSEGFMFVQMDIDYIYEEIEIIKTVMLDTMKKISGIE